MMSCCCFHLKWHHRWTWTMDGQFQVVILKIGGVSEGAIHSCSFSLAKAFAPVALPRKSRLRIAQVGRPTIEKACGRGFPAAHAGKYYVYVARLVYSDILVHFLPSTCGNLVILLFPTLQMWKFRHRIVIGFTQSYTSSGKLRLVFEEYTGLLG